MNNALVLKSVGPNFSLKDRTCSALREAILEVDVYDNATELRLDERSLAAQLGISRTPLREALGTLENEGLVEIRARKGVYLRRRGIDEVVDSITVWAALESMAARLACERASAADIKELFRLGTRYTTDKAKANLQEYSAANIEFHRKIMSLSRCASLQKLADGLFMQLRPVRRRAMQDSTRADRSVVDHMNIIKSIRERNADLAGNLVRDHTLRLGEYIRSSWKQIEAEAAKFER